MNKGKQSDNLYLGIEFGSTRIKSILIDNLNNCLGVGVYEWEDELVDGYYIYSYQNIIKGLQGSYKNLVVDYKTKYNKCINNIKAIGISGMMHGYLPLDKDNQPLCNFRTWRNNTASNAATILSEMLNYNIPPRWSIAHLYQAVLDNESHIGDVNKITTLSGYVSYLLSGELSLGVGEASGVFPINDKSYDKRMLDIVSENIKRVVDIELLSILPSVLVAGNGVGKLNKKGALLLDPSGELKAGAIMCPPEGDAGTGMVATNSIKKGSGNVSVGTSVFSMVVLKQPLKKRYENIDIVTTPSGDIVAMIHCNNCTTELNQWISMYKEVLELFSCHVDIDTVFETLLKHSNIDSGECGDMIALNYTAGENITKFNNGILALIRREKSNLSLKNIIVALLYSMVATLKIGFEALIEEGVEIVSLTAHGGIFKTKNIFEKVLASAINCKILIGVNSDYGGAFGMAILAKYAYSTIVLKNTMALDSYLDNVFINQKFLLTEPNASIISGLDKFVNSFKLNLQQLRCISNNINR